MPPTPVSTKLKQYRSMRDQGVVHEDASRAIRQNSQPAFTERTDKFGRQERVYADGTSEFNETPQSYYSKAGLSVPQQFKVTVPDTIPSTALNGDTNIQDLRAMRNSREQADIATNQFNTDYNNLINRINAGTSSINPLSDPNAFLNKFLLSRPTDTQEKLGTTYGGLQSATTQFAKDYANTAIESRTQFGLPEMQANLADTRNRIAERQVKLRETLRDFETNAERRGVAREFVESEKAKVQSDAATELADLAIIELAQLGNIADAKTSITELLADKKQAFEFEEKSILNEIARLTQLNTQEAEKRADQLTVALAEKKTRDDKALADEKSILETMSDAAANGADQGTLAAIRNAKSPQEATFLASPFIGRLDRMAKEASIRASNASAYKNELDVQEKQAQIERAAQSGVVPLDGEQQKTAMALGKQFEDESKNFKVQVNAYNQILASAEDPSAAGDLSLLFGYMKMLDPNSVVRETEFANAENAGGVDERVRAQWNKLLSGERLSTSMRDDFIDRAGKVYGSALDQQISLEDTYTSQGTNVYGLPKQAVDLIVRDIRAQGSVSETAFGLTLNNLSDSQLTDLVTSGLLTTPSVQLQ